jgi:hypothetical protein
MSCLVKGFDDDKEGSWERIGKGETTLKYYARAR